MKTPEVIYYANCDDEGTGFTSLQELREGDENWEEALLKLGYPNWPYFRSRAKAMAKCKTYLRSQIKHLQKNLRNLK